MIEDLLRDAATHRSRQGLKQDDIAKRMGLTQSRISDIENYRGNPSIELIGRYLDAVGVTLMLTPTAGRKPLTPPTGPPAYGEADPADVVRTELLEFDWALHGLDAVDDADSEWAEVLADRIAYVLGKLELLK